MGWAIVNQCSDPQLTVDLLARICAAQVTFINRDVGAYWGVSGNVRACTPDNPPAPGENVGLIDDNLPDAPNALAYHGWEGKPTIYLARNMCATLIDGAFSLSQGLGHELAEVWDVACNRWADDGTGNSYAMELCDAVESGFYAIDGVAVPDFLLPEFFEPGAVVDKYSFQGNAPAPFTTAPGGYQIMRLAGTGETQVQGTIHPDRMAKKRHFSSRTRRRGVKL